MSINYEALLHLLLDFAVVFQSKFFLYVSRFHYACYTVHIDALTLKMSGDEYKL